MNFANLPQLVDKRGELESKCTYSKRTKTITHRVWHHSLTLKALDGSDAASFAGYHVNTLGLPGIGYTFVIEPKNVINTPNSKRARIVYANDIDRRIYHVGKSNQFSLGICVAGDYRYDTMDDATLAGIAELHAALVKDGIGKYDKAHNEMSGYSWKACCEYNYRDAFDWKGSKPPTKPAPAPDVYTIQEADTLWSIAHKDGPGGVQVEDLIKANPGIDPTNLKIGHKINFGNAKKVVAQPENVKKPDVKVEVAPKPIVPYPGNVLKEGAKGMKTIDIKRVQRAAGMPEKDVDGKYGPKTTKAVKAYQKRQGLSQDGRVGPNTWNRMF
jgi:N-acetylmuramoyl-L-alanine amidase